MTLCVLDSALLRSLPVGITVHPKATVEMRPTGRGYLTAVIADVAGLHFCLYAETHTEPSIPQDVQKAVAAFNTDAEEWTRLVREVLDAEDEIVHEDRQQLDHRATEIQDTRRKLLGA